MMHDLEHLRDALPGEPDSCRLALMQAARSVKEEKPVKKLTFRTVLIAAVMLAAMMAVAVAATNAGLVSWFKEHYDATLPKAAQDVLNATEKTTLETDMVTFTVNELLCDGKIAYMTVEAQLKEGQDAILYDSSNDPYGLIGETLAKKLDHPVLSATSTYMLASEVTGLPLYSVSAWLELDEAHAKLIDCEMMDATQLEDGGLMLIRMAYFMEEVADDVLPVSITVQTSLLDPEAMDYPADSRQSASMAYSLPVHGVTEERTYAPENDAVLNKNFRLTSADAKKTCAGVYVTIRTQIVDRPMLMAEVFNENFEWAVLGPQGESYQRGISLSSEWDFLDENGQPVDEWDPGAKIHAVEHLLMLNTDDLPDSFLVTDGTVTIPVR